jgi:hypothetical protein
MASITQNLHKRVGEIVSEHTKKRKKGTMAEEKEKETGRAVVLNRGVAAH